MKKLSSRLKKLPLGSLIAIFAFLSIFLTVAIVGIWFVFDAIAGQTHSDATIFDSWWQILLFIVDVICVLGLGASIFCFIKYYEDRKVEKQNNPIEPV